MATVNQTGYTVVSGQGGTLTACRDALNTAIPTSIANPFTGATSPAQPIGDPCFASKADLSNISAALAVTYYGSITQPTNTGVVGVLKTQVITGSGATAAAAVAALNAAIAAIVVALTPGPQGNVGNPPQIISGVALQCDSTAATFNAMCTIQFYG